MKKTILIIIGNLILIIGLWTFITNILYKGHDTNIDAGFGSMLIYSYVLLNDFWINGNLKIKFFWKILISLLSLIGIWMFVTNTLESGRYERIDESMTAGFGGALFALGTLLKKDLSKNNNSPINGKSDFKTLLIAIFVILFTMFGLHNNDIKDIKMKVSDSDYRIDKLEKEIKNNQTQY